MTSSELAGEAIDRYVQVATTADPDLKSSPAFQFQVELMRRSLAAADSALEAEGLSAAARLRVLCVVIYGVPDQQAGEQALRAAVALTGRMKSLGALRREEFERGVAESSGGRAGSRCFCGRPDCLDRG